MKQTVLTTTIIGAVLLATAFNTLHQAPSPSIVTPEITAAFQKWSTKFARLYSSPSEHTHRLSTFARNYNFIKTKNASQTDYTFGLNEFSDLSPKEFSARYLANLDPATLKSRASAPRKASLKQGATPTAFDWAAGPNVPQVKYEGTSNCKASYAFSAANAIEALQLAHPKLTHYGPLAAQEYIDCTGNFGNYGCNGGWPSNNLSYSISYGVNFLKNYPYNMGTQGRCKGSSGFNFISTFYKVNASDNEGLKTAVWHSPVSAVIDGYAWLHHYKSGVYTGVCGNQPSYAVLVTGYGFQGNQAYWTLQTSFGTSYGRSGYAYLRRNAGFNNNSCLVNQYAVYPFVNL